MPSKKVKTYYLAGPMSGIPKFNFPAFDEASKALRENGFRIISPAELDDPKTRKVALASRNGNPNAKTQKHSWGDFLSRDVKIVADQCNGIIFMPGWTESKGARLEAYVGLCCKHEFWLYVGKGRIKWMPSFAVLSVIYTRTETGYDFPAQSSGAAQ